MRVMYDAVTVANLPEGGDLYAGYVNGRYANVDAIRARFPDKRVVTIAVTVAANADVLDVERGNARPDQAPGWVVRQRGYGANPTVYCPLSLLGECIEAFSAQGVTQPNWWVAHYDDDPTIPISCVAKQHGGDTAGGYDVSSVRDYWPGIDPINQAPQYALDRLDPTGETDMLDQNDLDRIAEIVRKPLAQSIPDGGYEPGSIHDIIRSRNFLDGQQDSALAAIRAAVAALPVTASPAGVPDDHLADRLADVLARRLSS